MDLILYQPRQVLVTGGAGFIGSNFVRHLLQDSNINVVNLDLLTYAGSMDNLQELPNSAHHHFVQGNICDQSLITKILIQYDIDTIVHFAAESHVDRSIAAPLPFIETNILGTFTLLNAAREYWQNQKKWDAKHCRFHHISTDEVFGTLQLKDPSFTEESNYAPNSPYSASKAGADHLVRSYFYTYGLPITISHCSNNYGPYQHTEKFIPTILRACLQQTHIPIYGNGMNIRDWLYVGDHCQGIDTIIKKGKIGETYHLGGNNEWDNLSLAKEICQMMDAIVPMNQSYQSLITHVTDRPGHDFRYSIDYSKISQTLGWKPKETFRSGLLKTIKFYLETRS